MSIFRRKKVHKYKYFDPGRFRFMMGYAIVRGLTESQYEKFKTHLDEIYSASRGMDKIKTPDEKLDEANEFLEQEMSK